MEVPILRNADAGGHAMEASPAGLFEAVGDQRVRVRRQSTGLTAGPEDVEMLPVKIAARRESSTPADVPR
jgi:hypothetical protein